jgi:threonine/homoserine/homoserine lactone efflux protein
MAIRISIIALAFIILLLIDSPSLGTIVLLAGLAVVLLLVVELLRASALRNRPT